MNVLGVGIHAVNMERSVEFIRDCVGQRTKAYVCVTGVHGVMEAQRDPHFRAVLNSASLVVPDGMPMVWAGRLQRKATMGRVYGPDLMLQVCRALAPLKARHYLYGGRPGVVQELKAALENKAGAQVVGMFTPPFRRLTAEEEKALADDIRGCAPDVLWVGLSTPKQERFMSEFIHRLDATVMLGVGAAFDLHTGRMQDAPQWMKRSGLQWLHRLKQDPKRLWRRYLRNNPEFVLRYAWQMCTKHSGVMPSIVAEETHGD